MSDTHDPSTLSDTHDTPAPPPPLGPQALMQAPVGRRGFIAQAGAGFLSTRLALPLLGSGAALILSACGGHSRGSGDHPVPELLPRDEWREILPADRYRILFEDQTEPAGSSPLDRIYDPGTYICAACFQPLFSSEAKYDSTTGWPSFWTHLPGAVGTRPDDTFFMRRTECHCSRCGGHQGHVFDDGPPPTGERWCINGLALEFVPEGQPLPELRG